MSEPIFHFFADCLPDNDPKAFTGLYCIDCTGLVHAGNNETMQAWFDTPIGVICLDCFYNRYTRSPLVGDGWAFDELGSEDERP